MLYHISPNANLLNEFKKGEGRYNGFMFFLQDRTGGPGVCAEVFEVDENELNIATLYDLEDKGQVEELMELVGCDEDTAWDLLFDDANIFDVVEDGELAGELGWDIQALQGEMATANGYDGVKLQDENGAVYLINMNDDDVFSKLKVAKELP